MNFSILRRAGMATAIALGAAAVTSPALAASEYPARPIRLIVPYAAGGGPDVVARKTAEALAAELGTTVVVENRVGAGGILAGEFVARAAPDGYTLMVGASSHVTQKILQPAVNFDPVADFTHIVRTGYLPQVLVVPAGAPYASVQQLVDAAKSASDPLNYGSGGIGSAAHLAGAAFSSAAGIEAVHIPYRGSVEIVPGLIRGDIAFAFPVASTALPHIADGKVRALAVSSGERLAQLPDVPTLNEVFGRKDLNLDAWTGIWAPKGLPQPIADRLEAAFKAVYAQPEMQQFHEQAGTVLATSDSPAGFTEFVRTETDKYQRIIEDNDIEVAP